MTPSALLEQLKVGLAAANQTRLSWPPAKDARIIICGMGGSIMPAEALSMLWLNQPPIYINRTAYLPHWADASHLVIGISWSGQTEETISCFEEAITKHIPVGVITTGGHLAEKAKKEGVPLILLPAQGLNPRDALGIMLSALLTLLNPTESELLLSGYLTGLTLISHSDTMEDSLKPSLFSETALLDLAAGLAQSIEQKTPLLYSSHPWRFLGSFWKIFFNENAKIHAFFNELPGAGHNEIAAITKQDSRFFYLLLRDPQDHPTDHQKLGQLAKFLEMQKTDHEIITLVGQSRLEKILNQYLLASAVSMALANSLGADPHSTETIENFKHLS